MRFKQLFDRRAGGIAPRAPFFASPAERSNRRRTYVFLIAFATACIGSLSYTFLRPAEYRASARIQVTPGSVSLAEPGTQTDPTSVGAAGVQREAISSRPVIERAVQRVRELGYDVSSLGADPAGGMQSALEVRTIDGTNVLELSAWGPNRELLAPALNAIVDAYRQHAIESHRGQSSESLAQAREEAAKLDLALRDQRRDAEAFRSKHSIVSLEREENHLLSRLRGLNTALNNANERVSVAEGKLSSIEQAIASGRSAGRSRENTTLSVLEQRVSLLREEMRSLERAYTAEYLAIDPRAMGLSARIRELDEQIATQRELARRAALDDAREELSSARESARRIEIQIEEGRGAVQQFTARLNEYRALQDRVGQLEAAHRDASQRAVRLEASERARAPAITVIELATIPQSAWRPLYARDAALAAGGSFVLALLAMWFVELFNRSDPMPTLVLAQSLSPAAPIAAAVPGPSLSGSAPAALAASGTPLLPGTPFPRELTEPEIAQLVRTADRDTLIPILLLLSGLTVDEVIALKWDDVDLEHRFVRIGGGSPRALTIHEPLVEAQRGRIAVSGAPVCPDKGGGAIETEQRFAAALLCAAHDADVERAFEVTPDVLRHTYLAFLVRQGIRFADLIGIAGNLSVDLLGAYSMLSPRGERRSMESIEQVIPALRNGTCLAGSELR